MVRLAPRGTQRSTSAGERLRELLRGAPRRPRPGGRGRVTTRVPHLDGAAASNWRPRRSRAPPLPSSWVCTATWTQVVPRCKPRGRNPPLAPSRRPRARSDLRLLRDQPGPRLGRRRGALREPAQRLLAAAARRGLHAAPASTRRSSSRCSSSAIGVTNAAYRTTPGSGDLRRGDFDRARLERLAAELDPVAIAFVGKEAYRGLFNERPELGPQLAHARPDGALRAAVDLAGERGRAVRRAAALVPRAARVARAGASARRCARCSSTPTSACCSSSSRTR